MFCFWFYFSLLLQLRSGGAQILEGCIAEIPNISSLDISDNGEARVDTVFTVILNIVYLDFDLMLCLYLMLRFGFRPDHSLGVAGQKSLHPPPLTGQELQ